MLKVVSGECFGSRAGFKTACFLDFFHTEKHFVEAAQLVLQVPVLRVAGSAVPENLI